MSNLIKSKYTLYINAPTLSINPVKKIQLNSETELKSICNNFLNVSQSNKIEELVFICEGCCVVVEFIKDKFAELKDSNEFRINSVLEDNFKIKVYEVWNFSQFNKIPMQSTFKQILKAVNECDMTEVKEMLLN